MQIDRTTPCVSYLRYQIFRFYIFFTCSEKKTITAKNVKNEICLQINHSGYIN